MRQLTCYHPSPTLEREYPAEIFIAFGVLSDLAIEPACVVVFQKSAAKVIAPVERLCDLSHKHHVAYP